MPNPLFGNKVSPNGATAPNDSLNDSYKRYRRGYNRFDLSRTFYNTERYADINLIEVLEGVEGDKLPFGNKHDIRTHTLGSPIMFDIYKKKTYFMVDNQAILPNNWKKVYKQPNKGDDVPINVNCVSSILYDVFQFLNFYIPNYSDNIPRTRDGFNYLIRSVLILESLFSNGSLLSSMNCHLSSIISVLDEEGFESNDSFDKWFDTTFGSWSKYAAYIPSISDQRNFCTFPASGAIEVTIREFFDLLRSASDFNIVFVEGDTSYTAFFESVIDSLKRLRVRINFEGSTPDTFNLNLSRLIAYQLVCAQFYTRDSVDNVYTAPDFIDNARSVIRGVVPIADLSSPQTYYWPKFNYNGTAYDFDVFSGKIMNLISHHFFGDYFENGILHESMLSCYHYLHSIFFYRKSLRYGDYFVGAKTLPYAPMDVTADVVGNGVSALDMTRSILMQRFANAVERVSNTWKDYLSGVMDGVAPPDPTEPRFLASSISRVGGFEVENTTNENQGNIVTILKGGDSKYMYEVEVGEPCIIIGVSTYEIPRVYSNTLDRFFKHFDRFDMFNKFMQNIGDQEITNNERNAGLPISSIFAYTPRHMEYKQRYPIASGGFIEFLKGYSFITDNKESGFNDLDLDNVGIHISPFYLRNRNGEFDRFYSSLTGLSLASYFHFICKYDCICKALRQMEYSPSIL